MTKNSAVLYIFLLPNTENYEVVSESKIFATSIDNEQAVDFSMVVDDETLLDLIVFDNGDVQTEDGEVFTIDEYLASNGSDEGFGILSTCTTMVTLLYDSYNAFTCYAMCVAAGFVNIGAGLACGSICVIIRDYSKSGAVDAICG